MVFNKYKYNKDFTFKNNRVHLTKEGLSKIKRFKKITGSRIGSILGTDTYKTPFQTWCAMFGFYQEEENRYFLDAGTELEEKLRDYAERKMGKKFKTYDARLCGYDVFKDNEVFGGIPDGEELDANGNVVSILEIKTAQVDKYKWFFEDNQFKLQMQHGSPVVIKRGGGLSKWFSNGGVVIPQSYRDQISLYMYLRGVRKGYFCVGFMNKEDYEDHESVYFCSEFNNYKDYESEDMKLLADEDRILVWEEYELDVDEFGEKVHMAKKWYEDHIIGGVSPELTTEDLTWFRYGYPDIK